MSKKHNKKRNSLIVYEAVVADIAASLLKEDKQRQAKAVALIKKHFNKKSELHKEFRILNSMRKTHVTQASVASSILSEAKSAIRRLDHNKIEAEKTKLIHDVNSILGESTFDNNITDYKFCATIGLMSNEWKNFSGDLSRLGLYENSVIERMISPPNETPDVVIEGSSGMARVVTSMMMKKFNEKYSNLSDDQKSILRSFIFSATNEEGNKTISLKLTEIREKVVSAISKYQCDDYTAKKLNEAKQRLMSENVSSPDEKCVTRFLVYSAIQNEIESKEESEQK